MQMNTRKALALGVMGLAAAVAAPTAMAAKGDWLIRGGATMVDPKSHNLSFDGGEGATINLNVDDNVSFGFNITYMMTDNLGVELLAAWPFKHDVKAEVTDSTGTTSLGKIAEAEQLPPTLSLQYHFIPDGAFRPYIGVGVNWTMFMSEKIDPALADDMSLDDSFGLAAQIGADVAIGDTWFVNFDIRYIDIQSDLKITTGGVTEKVGKVQIDPMVYSIMIGAKF